jgi:multidrug efflux system membrane fusion protein
MQHISRKPRCFFVSPVFLLAFVILLTISCGTDNKPEVKEVIRPAKIMTVGDGTETVIYKFPGNVRAAQRIDLAFDVPGKVVEFPVKEGQDIQKGDLVARLDERDFQNNLAAAKAKYDNAKADYDRNIKLFKEGIIAQAQLDKYNKNREVFRAEVKLKQDTLKDIVLKAPFSGRIVKRYIDIFKEVQAKEVIVSLQDISSIEVVVDVPEWVMVPIRERGSVNPFVEFPAVPGEKYPLKLKEFSSEADSQTQTYRVVFTMPTPEEMNILPGMTATVTGSNLRDSLSEHNQLIPIGAIFADETGKNYIWLVEDSMAVKKQEVEVGSVTGENIYILKGLKPGSRIVTAGVNYLQPDMKVREINVKTGD